MSRPTREPRPGDLVALHTGEVILILGYDGSTRRSDPHLGQGWIWYTCTVLIVGDAIMRGPYRELKIRELNVRPDGLYSGAWSQPAEWL